MAQLTHQEIMICASKDLVEGGRGVRFELPGANGLQPAFAVRFQGQVYAYRNRCAHRSVELDWNAREFFDSERRHLVCATHGALYHPATGACVAGPCQGKGLMPLTIREIGGEVWLIGASAVG